MIDTPHVSVRYLPVFVVVVVLALFPIGWLGEIWWPAGILNSPVFSTIEAHAIGHMLIFLVVGGLALLVFPNLVHKPWRYLAIMLALGVAQECFQLLYKQRPIAFDDVRDLGPDIFGAVVALGIIRMRTHFYAQTIAGRR